MRERVRLRLVGFVLLLVVLFAGAGAGFGFLWRAWSNKILPGIKIGNIDVSGLTEEEAEAKLALVERSFLSSPVEIFLDESRRWRVSRHDLGFQLEMKRALQSAFLLGRSGPIWRRLYDIWVALHKGYVIPLKPYVDRQKAEEVLSRLVKETISPPVDAALLIAENDRVIIKQGKPGQAVDYQAVIDALSRMESPYSSKIRLKLRRVEPKVRTEDVLAMKINGLLSSYTTYFDVSNVNRTYNINVAADAIDNIVIKPGEVFSFNRIVGPRSKEAGYKEALVIVEDQFTPGIGGGVCQVSSTLYNAALLAGLEVLERHNHSLPVAYVPLGRDATVAYGGYDLKFRNNTRGCICIRARVSGGALTVKIFGDVAEKKNITIESIVDDVLEPKVIKKEDPNLYVGKVVEERKGVRGYRVRVFAYIREPNGQVIKKLLSKDLYKPIDQIVRVGTKPLAVAPPLPNGEGNLQVQPEAPPVPIPDQQSAPSQAQPETDFGVPVIR
ncbi:MAG: VanW family protein [Thermacetogeniaceae bacterium]